MNCTVNEAHSVVTSFTNFIDIIITDYNGRYTGDCTVNNLSCSLCTKLVKIVRGDETEVQCDDCCRNNPVVALCIKCTQYLCEVCNSYHVNKEHDVITVQSIENRPTHSKKELDHYCETCDKVISHYCVTKDHVGHTFDTVESTASKHRNELTKIITPVDEMSTSLTKAKEDINLMKGKIENQAKKLRSYLTNVMKSKLLDLMNIINNSRNNYKMNYGDDINHTTGRHKISTRSTSKYDETT